MKREKNEAMFRPLDDAALGAVAGGTECETLVKLRVAAEKRGDDAWAAYFQGAINGSGCSGPNCHGARTGTQHA